MYVVIQATAVQQGRNIPTVKLDVIGCFSHKHLAENYAKANGGTVHEIQEPK